MNPIGATTKRKVLVVDDHPIVREGLSLLINQQSDLAICGEAGDAPTALERIEATRPDIVLLDISLDGPDGLELLKLIRARDGSLPVLVLSMHDESLYAERALRAGANGYIMKHEATDGVLDAIRRILKSEVCVSERVAGRILQQIAHGSAPSGTSLVEKLSDRELEVFRLIGDGYSTRQIADELNLSVKTIESYQAHIKRKLSLENARELSYYAIQWKLRHVGNKKLDPAAPEAEA